MDMSQTCSFLTLPRELRDCIYLYSIQANWNPYASVQVVRPVTRDGQHYFWPEQGKWQPIRLLSVCRQTRSEVQDLLSAQHANKQIRLELMVKARGYGCTPTWTHLNYALRHQDSLDLHVNLVLSSTESFRRNNRWQQQPGPGFRALLNFLGRFIFQGPSFPDAEPPFRTPGPHFIDTLSVHIMFDDWYTPATWPGAAHEIFRMLKALAWLDTAHKYIGKVRASTEYTSSEGEDVKREKTWEVRTGLEARFSTLREEDWARTGFHFGQAWLQEHAGWAKLEQETRLPSS